MKMIKRRSFENLTGLLVGCSLFLLQGCGGDPGSSAFMGMFEPIPHNPSARHVDMVENVAHSIGTRLAIDMKIIDIDIPVYAAAFDLTYDPTIVRFFELLPGGFLEGTSSQGVSYTANIQEGTTNVLIVSVSQTGGDPGSTGTGVLVTPVFELLKPGCTNLKFVVTDSNNVQRSQLLTPVGADSPNLLTIDSVTWSPGGKITIRLEGDTQECVPGTTQNP